MAKKKNNETKRSDADRRVRQCERLARLMQTLHLIMGKGRWDAQALAEELECSTRTVHRLLQTLSMAGVPWYFDEKTRAYRVRAGYKFPLVDDQIVTPTRVKKTSKDLSVVTAELIERGEKFSESLDQFLVALRQLNKEGNHGSSED